RVHARQAHVVGAGLRRGEADGLGVAGAGRFRVERGLVRDPAVARVHRDVAGAAHGQEGEYLPGRGIEAVHAVVAGVGQVADLDLVDQRDRVRPAVDLAGLLQRLVERRPDAE